MLKLMAKYYRGICLSKNNKDKAIYQTHYYKFKVNWVRRECWLHILFEKAEDDGYTIFDEGTTDVFDIAGEANWSAEELIKNILTFFNNIFEDK